MRARGPDSPSSERSRQLEERERVARLLRHAFPLGESGSFSGLLEAIGDHRERLEPK
ncbi:MAG TPA: hypothetical protein VFK28_06845 [Sphingomicrobium sp.]|nr:hypothetical protein [Sphingomicrobium sp.]